MFYAVSSIFLTRNFPTARWTSKFRLFSVPSLIGPFKPSTVSCHLTAKMELRHYGTQKECVLLRDNLLILRPNQKLLFLNYQWNIWWGWEVRWRGDLQYEIAPHGILTHTLQSTPSWELPLSKMMMATIDYFDSWGWVTLVHMCQFLTMPNFELQQAITEHKLWKRCTVAHQHIIFPLNRNERHK